MRLGDLKTLRCERCGEMTQHVFEADDSGAEKWWCLCGLATDGTDRQWHIRETEGETV